MTHTKTYRAWQAMKQRCLGQVSPKYYLDRGIAICDRWLVFENFLEDMGESPEGLSLERIDNNGSYEPNNCEWATREEQMINSRVTKLTFEQIQEIRRLRSEEGMSVPTIARKFDLSTSYVSKLLRGEFRRNC